MEGMMVFNSREYDSLYEMWESVLAMQKELIKNHYATVVYYEDCGNYILEYGHNKYNNYGAKFPCWYSDDEIFESGIDTVYDAPDDEEGEN